MVSDSVRKARGHLMSIPLHVREEPEFGDHCCINSPRVRRSYSMIICLFCIIIQDTHFSCWLVNTPSEPSAVGTGTLSVVVFKKLIFRSDHVGGRTIDCGNFHVHGFRR